MKIHEYQAKAILARYGVPVPRGEVAFSAQEARRDRQAPRRRRRRRQGADSRRRPRQGRRRQGRQGPRRGRERRQADLLGRQLVTYQTGPAGQRVGRLLVEEGLAIDRELYLEHASSIARPQQPVLMVSAEGGMDIEEVAAKTPGEDPQGVHRSRHRPGAVPGPASWPSPSASTGDQVKKATKMMLALYQAFIATDASLLEINPLIVTKGGDLLALDAKMNFDDNALFRHPDIRDLRDLSEEDPLEVEASKFSLNYIRLDGNIGCMVNGAGLAMATMDIIKLSGGHAGQLPRRRRRRQRRADSQRLQDPDVGHERQGGAHQHLRRHPALRRAGRRASSPRSRNWACRCRSSSA